MKQGISRGKVNYIVDVAIGLGFLLSAFSGIVLLFIGSGDGYRGGRNIHAAVTVLGMDRWFIKDMHTISSIIMAAGVLGHLILHWKWMTCMTKNIFKRKQSLELKECEV